MVVSINVLWCFLVKFKSVGNMVGVEKLINILKLFKLFKLFIMFLFL